MRMDYIEVADRIGRHRDPDRRYPDGSFQVAAWGVLPTEAHGEVLWMRVRFYRTPQDERPGEGMSWMPLPGATNYTRGSELENVETSARGRALVAALAADTRASADEIRQHQQPAQPPPRSPEPPPDPVRARAEAWWANLTEEQRTHVLAQLDGRTLDQVADWATLLPATDEGTTL